VPEQNSGAGDVTPPTGNTMPPEAPERPGTTPVTPSSAYNEGTVLVKVKVDFSEADLGTLEYTAAEPLYDGSQWYAITLADAAKTEETVAYLTSLNTFEKVDYDYVMNTETEGEANVTKHALLFPEPLTTVSASQWPASCRL